MSKIEVNTVEPQCGTTLTLGGSGDTVSIPSGAKISGVGTVSWQTAIKTSTFTAASGEGYFVDTSSGGVTVNLPAGSVGAVVSIKDYAQTFDTGNCTVAANGSEKIEGLTTDLILSTEGVATTLVYGDATKGWQSVNSNEVTNTISFVTATGGTVTTSGNFKIHTFTGPGTFCVSCAGCSAGSNTVDYLVVAGGGGGGSWVAGGGGAGGYRFSNGTASGCYTAGPAPLGASALPVSVQGYPIAVGGGGTAASYPAPGPGTDGGNGVNSTFSTITSAGGGGGGGYCSPAPTPTQARAGLNGGSGGGSGATNNQPGSAGSGNTPSVSPPQGNNGGANTGAYFSGAGGGGAGAVGASVGCATSNGGAGGAGLTSCITASPVARGGGGGGSSQNGSSVPGGSGGGGGGAGNGGPASVAGTANTGGGGGGGRDSSGAAGGSGIVIIRYKFQ